MKEKKNVPQEFDVLKELIQDEPVQYIDIPMYLNIGDHLIAHGTIEFLHRYQIQTTHISELNFYPVDWLDSTNVVLFSGGGNFGDVYEKLHKLRKNLISRVKNKRIVILPQSIHYRKHENFVNDVDFFKSCGDVHICVRDSASLELAQDLSRNVYLLPDMAHNLANKSVFRNKIHCPPPKYSTLNFLRSDNEKRDEFLQMNLKPEGTVLDWKDLTAGYKDAFKRQVKINRFVRKYGLWRMVGDEFHERWSAMSWEIILHACDTINDYNKVLTDRLHVLILCQLLERNVEVIDNNLYSKLRNYYRTWSHYLPHVHFA